MEYETETLEPEPGRAPIPATLGAMLHSAAARNPDKPAVRCGDRSIAYEELDRTTSLLAAWLLRGGLKPGDRIAIHWPNSIETVQLLFAAFKAGLIAVPVNLRLKAPEIEYILGNSGALRCFSHPASAEVAQGAASACGNCPVVTALPELSGTADDLPRTEGDSPAAIIYTSGTTARPKGAVHTHRTLIATADEVARSYAMKTGDIPIAVMPLMHMAALSCVLLPAVLSGATTVLVAAFDPAAVLDDIRKFRCTILPALPALLQFVAEAQACNPRDVSSLRALLAGGDAVPLSLQNRAQELFGLPVQEIYGMSESVPLSFNPRDSIRAGSIGLPVAEMRLVDPEGREVPPGETGEIVVRTPASCIGYWNDPKATADLFRDGWLHTGDLGSRDPEGYHWFRGRLKQIVIRGGSNISPQEVEDALYAYPAVFEAGVVGMPDPVWGETVAAFVSLRPGTAVDESQLREFARQRLADYKTPERIFFIPELPKGPTGKVQRRALKEMLPGILGSR